MASKRGNAKPDDELGELFEGIGGDAPKKTAKSKAAGASKARTSADKPQKDILADLETQLGEQPERPNTPRAREPPASKGSPAPAKRSSTATPPPAADKLAEDRVAAAARKSGESTRSYHASFTPSATSSDLQDNEKKGTVEQTAPAAGGGWWGGIFNTASATATAAMKQAESAYKELQKNEEAKKFAEQVRGNVGALKGLKGFGKCGPDFPYPSIRRRLCQRLCRQTPCTQAFMFPNRLVFFLEPGLLSKKDTILGVTTTSLSQVPRSQRCVAHCFSRG